MYNTAEQEMDAGLSDRIEAAITHGVRQGQMQLDRRRKQFRRRVAGAIAVSVLLLSFLFTIKISPVFAAIIRDVPGLERFVNLIISAGFDNIKVKLDQQQTISSQSVVVPLVQANDFQISPKQFTFYKSNLELLNKLQGKSNASDNELINEMVKQELAVQYAKKAGLTVSEDEISQGIEKEKSSLNDPTLNDNNSLTVKELMKNRIRITGLTEDQFWNSIDTREEYKKAFLLAKLANQLIAQNKVRTMQDFSAFKDDLLQKSNGTFSINLTSIK
jgi:hypothetical protein